MYSEHLLYKWDSLLVDPSPFQQFGASFGTRQFTKEQEIVSTERAQNVVVT